MAKRKTSKTAKTKKAASSRYSDAAAERAIAAAKDARVLRKARRSATYTDSCNYAAELNAAGLSNHAIVLLLRKLEYPTRNGGNWWNQTARHAVAEGTVPTTPLPSPTPDVPKPRKPRSTGKAPRKPSRSEEHGTKAIGEVFDRLNAKQAAKAETDAESDKAHAIAVLDWFAGKPTGNASETAATEAKASAFADSMATADTLVKGPRRGLKRMTADGWENLPEPVKNAVIERLLRVMGI